MSRKEEAMSRKEEAMMKGKQILGAPKAAGEHRRVGPDVRDCPAFEQLVDRMGALSDRLAGLATQLESAVDVLTGYPCQGGLESGNAPGARPFSILARLEDRTIEMEVGATRLAAVVAHLDGHVRGL